MMTTGVIIGAGIVVTWFYLIESAKAQAWIHVAGNLLIMAGLYYGFTTTLEYDELREAVMGITGN